MNPKKLYTHLYKLLDDVTPLNVDCGKLCNHICCKGDKDSGMYLFPFEEVMYNKNDNWIKIYDSDFIVNNKPVKIAICNNSCIRNKRPLSCRIFPLFYNNAVVTDKRAKAICPLAKAIPLDEYNQKFVRNVKKVFNVLNKFKLTREYVMETQKLIDDFDFLKN